MILAYLLAALDTVGSAVDDEDFEARIDENAKLYYAVPPDYKHARYVPDGIISMLRLIPKSEWYLISGPSWVTQKKLELLEPNCKAKHAKYPILIDSNYVLTAALA